MLASLFSGAVAAAAVTAGYQSMAPEGQWYGSTFTGLARGSKQLALTYDDGPNDPHTLRLLEVLDKHNVKATFFLIGRYVRQRSEIARELAAAGHTAESIRICSARRSADAAPRSSASLANYTSNPSCGA